MRCAIFGPRYRMAARASGRLWASIRFVSRTARKYGYVASEHFDDKRLTLVDRFAQYALVAAGEAMKNSGRQVEAVITGCSAGGQDAMDAGFVDLYQKNSPRVNPMMVPRVMSSGAASHIAMGYGVTGPVYSVSTACSSANHAIGQAFWMIRNGHV